MAPSSACRWPRLSTCMWRRSEQQLASTQWQRPSFVARQPHMLQWVAARLRGPNGPLLMPHPPLHATHCAQRSRRQWSCRSCCSGSAPPCCSSSCRLRRQPPLRAALSARSAQRCGRAAGQQRTGSGGGRLHCAVVRHPHVRGIGITAAHYNERAGPAEQCAYQYHDIMLVHTDTKMCRF